ncbi:hypothetical protein CHISP_3671 [Chitinispirillum alkaliphilum]|nr:hypothetical protein CHISP_3671 [Chitinispirillum alkaliphilum]
MKKKNRNNICLQNKAIGVCVLFFYCFIGITSDFPHFHNHGPSEHHTCTTVADLSSFSDHTGHEQVLVSGCIYDQHSQKPCAPCMWQAMSKRHSAVILASDIISFCAQTFTGPPEYILLASFSYLLPEPRAPPLS